MCRSPKRRRTIEFRNRGLWQTPLEARTSDIKEAITIVYSDNTFFWNVLHGEAYRYWWEIMTRVPAYGVYHTEGFADMIEYRR
jgi:hypothetical protein